MTAGTALDRLRALVRIPTVSRLDESATDWGPFQAFIDALPGLYPATHGALDREIIGGYSLLYRWPGSTAGSPAVLMAHYDVVPAGDDGWQHPPFAAELVGDGPEQVVWGRGTLDDKGALVSIAHGAAGRWSRVDAPGDGRDGAVGAGDRAHDPGGDDAQRQRGVQRARRTGGGNDQRSHRDRFFGGAESTSSLA